MPHEATPTCALSGKTPGFRLLGALSVQRRGMPSLGFLTLTPGGLWISSFFHLKVTHVDQRSCPCKPWKEVRECSAWQPCLGLLRADPGQSLCAFSYDVFLSPQPSFVYLYIDSCLFYERLLGKFCYVTCEIPFGLVFRKRTWPKVGLILEEWHGMGSRGFRCRGSVQLLSFMSFESELLYSSFFICKLCLKKSIV